MKDRKLAVRYARALLSILTQPDQATNADLFLTALARTMDDSAGFRALMLDPAVSRSERIKLLRSLAESSAQTPEIGNFLETLVDNTRIASLPSIAIVFHEEREKAAGVVPAEITTASPLTEELKQRTIAAMEKRTGRKVRLTCRVDSDLIGGAVSKIGSTVFDGSLRTQLAELRRAMSQE